MTSGAASVSTCSSSERPSLGLTGTSARPDSSTATEATIVSSVDSAQTATRAAPAISPATAAAAPRSSA